MKDADRQTRTRLMALFAQHGFHPRTDLGQNFLIDLNLVEFIAHWADLSRDDVVLEIGSGTGGVTTFLSQQAGDVVSVEVDENMFRLASEVVAGRGNVTLLHCDALKNKNHFHPQVLAAVEEKLAVNPERRLKLISNLPYNIATPVVSNLVATDLPWVRMVVTIQWELAQRMTARPGDGHYGALSAWLGAQCEVAILRRLGPTVFWPRPQVDSAIIRLVPDPEGRARIDDRPFYQDFVRRLFQKRRKLLRPVLAGMYRKQLQKTEVDAILKEMGLEENARAEELDPPVLVELSNRVRQAVGPSGGDG